MQTTPIQYFISHVAYDNLVNMARRQGFIPWGSKRQRGLSEFLSLLSYAHFSDNRPPLIIQRHREEIAHGHAPVWRSYKHRIARMLTLTEDAAARYFKVAFEYEIVRTEPYLFGTVSMLTIHPAVGYVLEGIGLDWLKPDGLPKK